MIKLENIKNKNIMNIILQFYDFKHIRGMRYL